MLEWLLSIKMVFNEMEAVKIAHREKYASSLKA